MEVYVLSFVGKSNLRAFSDRETAVKVLMQAWNVEWVSGRQNFNSFFDGMSKLFQNYHDNYYKIQIEGFGQVETVAVENYEE